MRLFVLIVAILGTLAAVFVNRAAEAAEAPRTVVIGLDLSKSNPLVNDDAYAARAGRKAVERIEGLAPHSRVMLRTFGSYDVTANALKVDQVISARAKPDAVADGLRVLIANIPKLIRDGKLEAQGFTNILPFLDTMSQVVDCAAQPTDYILLTDGFEDSEYAKLKAGGKLPQPSGEPFKGCASLTILGLGQGAGSPSVTQRVRHEWRDWAKAAGFRHFAGLYDW